METRLKILYDAQVIDSAVYFGMLNVLTRLEQHWQLSIRHSQGEMLITHMANALMRASQGAGHINLLINILLRNRVL